MEVTHAGMFIERKEPALALVTPQNEQSKMQLSCCDRVQTAAQRNIHCLVGIFCLIFVPAFCVGSYFLSRYMTEG